METKVISASSEEAIARALEVLRGSWLVAFPTDTVYGVGALVHDTQAIEALYVAKGRDSAKAIAVLLGDPAALSQVTLSMNEAAWRLAERFWPGPLTLVVPRHPGLPGNLAPQPTIGVRMPNHPVALALLKAAGPMAVTSANRSGEPSPTRASEVLEQLGGRISLILDGGEAPGGLPSTVVDCTGADLKILRAGPLSLEDLLKVL